MNRPHWIRQQRFLKMDLVNKQYNYTVAWNPGGGCGEEVFV